MSNRTFEFTEATSERLGVPVNTLRYWRHIGKGPKSFKIGRRVAYRVEDIEAWLSEQYEAAEGERVSA